MFTLDARVGFGLGKSFRSAPSSCGWSTTASTSNDTLLYPGVMLNYKPGNFFVGAGVVLPIAIGGGSTDSGNPAPKINIGYQYGNLMFTLYALTWTESGIDFLDINYVGVTVGYRF